MSSVVRNWLLASLFVLYQVGAEASAKDLYVLLLGDRLAANCHVLPYPQQHGVVVLGSDGSERPAADPLPGADCNKGSMWMPLAARLKQQPGIDKVVLVPVAIDGVKAEDWTANTAAAQRLAAAVSAVKKRGARIDYALWQQGLADSRTSGNVYMNHMLRTIKRTTVSLPIDKWIIATVADCGGRQLEQVREAQRKLGRQAALSRFSGPAMDLPPELQAGECTFNARGQEMMAQRWFEAIQRTDILSQRYRMESLIYFFK